MKSLNGGIGQLLWAIATGEENGFIGRYWRFRFEDASPGSVLRVRLFETRKQARIAWKEMRLAAYQPFPLAKVVRVVVKIEVAP